MAIPRIFISSTWYDLRYIRENLKFFIRSLGYDPVLSEEGSVFYNPRLHTAEACLIEVPNTQLFVLIIGGRKGSTFPAGTVSVTNAEYREAVKRKIPIFALIEQSVHNDYQIYVDNKNNKRIDATLISYPAVDDPAVFQFITEVRSKAVNNALVPFRNFDDIRVYLLQQWAGMMFSYLTSENESARVTDTLELIGAMNARIEMLTRQILKSVGSDEAKFAQTLYDEMFQDEAIRDLAYLGLRPTPASLLRFESYADCAKNLGKEIRITNDKDNSVSTSGSMSRTRFNNNEIHYKKKREYLLKLISERGITVEEFLLSN